MIKSIIPMAYESELSPGACFDSTSRYTLKKQLGEGGMGEVWLAERLSAGTHTQKVAVKFLSNADTSQELAQEALRISGLSHDNIVPFIDSGHDMRGRFFVAMAYIEGVDLQGLCDLAGVLTEGAYKGTLAARIPEAIVGFIMFMVLRALHHAHTFKFDDGIVGLIHRDVSPGNILIDEARGFVKLTDFGVAVRQSSDETQNQIAGKIPYMAPEVLTGSPVDTRSDIYALGLVAYELLTGFNPNIHPDGLVSVIGAITHVMLAIERPLKSPHEVVRGIDPMLSEIISRMLAKEPSDRYSSAEEVISDLSLCLYNHGVGPTTNSLASYLKLLRNPQVTPTESMRQALPFLVDDDNNLNFCPKWELTAEAKQIVAEGGNPGREAGAVEERYAKQESLSGS